MRSRFSGRHIALCSLLLSSAPLAAQAPNTDVWLAPLSRVGDSLIVGTPRNLTNRPGYDNQPSFTPDSKSILYTSTRADGQADIYRYDLASGAITRLTSTPESEYSATVTPDGKFFSVVRVERDSTQRLWKFPLAGGEPSLVLENVKPVGYHAWVDDTTLALFVLGQPATLQLADVRTGQATRVDSAIGRALQPVPTDAFSYTRRDSLPEPLIVQQSSRPLPRCQTGTRIRLPGRNEYHVWLDKATRIVTAQSTGLYEFRVDAVVVPEDGNNCGHDARWRAVRDLASEGAHNITRLAVSPDGRWLAFVAEASAP